MLVSGATNPSSDVPEKLRLLAGRLICFAEGSFEPSPPPALLEELTDELLVVALDAVNAVAITSGAKMSGKARLRLLAWVVADARGASTPMEKPLAETVGKRLERQALKVRAEIDCAVEAAIELRDLAHARARADPAHRASLRADLAVIDDTVRLAREKAAREVYVGFHELDQLLPARVQREALPPVLAAAVRVADEPQPALPAIPRGLAVSLGHDGLQALWAHAADHGFALQESEDWAELLPGLVRETLDRAAVAYAEGQVDTTEALEAKYKAAYAQCPRCDQFEGELEARDERIETLETYISVLEESLRQAKRGAHSEI